MVSRAAVAAALLTLALAAQAAAVLESASGDVRIAADGPKPAAATQGAIIPRGSSVITGADAMAILRLDDEQKIAVAPGSELNIAGSELTLSRGAIRVVSSEVEKRNHANFRLRTPHVNLGGRGSDFSAAVIGQTFWAVNEGVVTADTSMGTGDYGKGSYGRAQAFDRFASGVSAAGLPLAVLLRFDELNSPRVAAQLGLEPAP
jgi:hypothetical protein